MRLIKVFVIIASLLCSSCTMLKPEVHPASLNPPTPFLIPTLADSTVAEEEWWLIFNNSELNHLIEQALNNNPSIEQVWVRLKQARVATDKVGATRFPALSLSSGLALSENLNSKESTEQWSGGAGLASYELDLWGRVNAIREAAKLDEAATALAVEAAAMSLSAEVAIKWHNLIYRRLDLTILEEQLKSNKTFLELIELRFRNSLSTGLDVLQQRQTVEATAGLIPIAKRAKRSAEIELAALLGQIQHYEIKTSELCELPEIPDLGVPATLLNRRPDIKKAIANLEAASWRIAAAKADRLPAIRLSSRIESQSSSAEQLFNNWIGSIAGNLSAPFFDGGSRRAEVRRTELVLEEKLAAYKEAVVNAIREVEQNINLEKTQADYSEAVTVRLKAASQAYDEAISRYRNGAVDYTTVLFQLNTMQQLERSQILAKADQITYRINLLRSLGGSWTKKLDDLRNNYE